MFFQNQHACVVRDWKRVFFPFCSLLSLVAAVGGYFFKGVEIGALSCIFLYFCGCWGGGWVCACTRTHTQTTWVLDVSPGVGRTPGKPEESRSTKAQYTCRRYRCTKYICLYI